MAFSELGLGPEMAQAAHRQGYLAPTPVQLAAIGPILQGQDVCVRSQTGSGKTAAFCLPLFQQLINRRQENTHRAPGPRQAHALVLAPTREIAAQIGETLRALAQGLPNGAVKISVVFGGVSTNPQMMGLRGGADIVVATPGRLLDLARQNALDLSHVGFLVLDEADRLLDLGFSEELGQVIALLPTQRQTLLFSATFPQALQTLASRLLRQPVPIDIASNAITAPQISLRAIEVDAPRRTQLLRHLAGLEHWPRVLVFVATKHAAEMVADKLRKGGVTAEPFHGLLSQGKRSQVLMDFKARLVQVVVATDLAARGLDIADLPVVVNFDLPRSPVDYTHRVGRTARAGASGLAVSFVSPDVVAHWRLIAKRQGLPEALEVVAGFEPTRTAEPDTLRTPPPLLTGIEPRGGIKGKRPNKKDKLRALKPGP